MRVLLLDIDGLQPAYVGPYGCEWTPTPTLDRWAAAGIVFDRHFADCPEAEIRSWRTGRHPLAPGETSFDLLADLRRNGVQTARVGTPGPSDGWDIEIVVKRDTDSLALKSVRRAVREVIEKVGDATNAFIRIEIDALLPPWLPSAEAIADCFADDDIEPWTESVPESIDPDDDDTFTRLQHTYAAAVATLDAGLGTLLKDSGKRGWGDEAFRLLTARRGFPLGEHGPVGFEAAELNEELVHLPLMIRRPGAEQAGHRVGAMTQPMDIAPTLGELFGLPVPASDDLWSGRSLVPPICGRAARIRNRAITGLRRDGENAWAFRVADWYLMLDDVPDGQRRLYVKPDDQWEVNDVRSRNQELAEEMEAEFRTGAY